MSFYGLFVGIDRYHSPVTRLSCAKADALALGGLFEDSLGGLVTTLLDEDATRAGIADAIDRLGSCAEDDFVVISFSGHGTEDHRLVPVDADPDHLEKSCFALDDLAQKLDSIPAKQLLVILDCCFSGGFGGARVFAPSSMRSPFEDRSSLQGLVRGSGRVVLTASGAGEPALETVDFGHGLLSYYLLSGLQGQDGLGNGDRVALLDLLNYVMSGVKTAAERMSCIQTPTLYGTVEGVPALSILTPGARYAASFPSRIRAPATTDWESLSSYGFTNESIALWKSAMPGLNELQLRAVNEFGVLDRKSLLVVAPTGAGKTMVGELAAMRAVAEGSRAVILLPLKALVNDKYDYMTRVYGDEVRVIRATGDHSDQVGDLLSGHYDLALLTYEKFMGLVLGHPHLMRGLSVVVVDEVQTLGDPGRGASLEFLLTLIRAGHGRQASPQIVALSAVIGDTHGFERWLGGSLLRTTARPIPLKESVIDGSGSVRTLGPDGTDSQESRYIQPQFVGGSQSNKPWIIPLVQRLTDEGKKVIVFRATRGDTVGTARYLAQSLGLAAANDAIAMLPGADRSSASNDLRSYLIHGVGFHNSDLDQEERRALETCFRTPDSPLRVLVATTTLAMGVNTPAEAVVIAGLTHPGNQPHPYSIAEYKNMAGRAGRLGHTQAGESFIVATANPGPGQAWQRYVLGQPEPIRSHFLAAGTDPQTLIVRSLVALQSNVSEADLLELLENSFAVWLKLQNGQAGWDRNSLNADLIELQRAQLIDKEPGDKLTLTALGRFAGESGVEVRSITRIGSALRYAPSQLRPADIVALAQVTVELEQLHIPANAKSNQEKLRWPQMLVHTGVARTLLNGLHVGGIDSFKATKRALACLLFMSDRPMEEIERILLEHHRERTAVGNIRQVTSRTRDVIEAVVQVGTFTGRRFSEDLSVDDLAVQLEVGLPSYLIGLAQEIGTVLNRGEYLALGRRSIHSIEQIRQAGREGIGAIIGVTATDRLFRLIEGKAA